MKSNWLHALGLSIQYFSRIPLPLSLRYEEETIKRSIFFLPFVGWIIGIFLYYFYQGIQIFFPIPVLSVLLISFLMWMTGALHADGWMDVWDGIGSSRSKERMLIIMQDSRVGAMGVVGFVILFAIKATSLVVLIKSPFRLEVLMFTPIIARWGVLLAINLFPYARKKGLGMQFKDWLTWPIFLLTFFWIIPMFWFSAYFLLMLAVIILFVLVSGFYFTKKLGGLTGDVYGWLIEGGEALLWLTFVIWSY